MINFKKNGAVEWGEEIDLSTIEIKTKDELIEYMLKDYEKQTKIHGVIALVCLIFMISALIFSLRGM